jgi:aldehyde:ferredoxin oxidoreductase
LTRHEWAREDLDEDLIRLFPGGSLLAARYLLTETSPRLGPFDPEELLIFASSVIAGHRAPGLSRFSVVARSPLTSGIGEARAEGPFAVALKESGYDAIIFQGRSEAPVYLLVAEGSPSILPAEEVWGLDTGESTDTLQAAHPGSHVATIGPAGERLVKYASVVSDRSFPAARMGLGAVMGAKLLKAVVLLGGAAPQVADATSLGAIRDEYQAGLVDNPVTRWQHQPPGFGAWLTEADAGTFAVENYRTSVFDTSGFSNEAFLSLMAWSEDGCPGCPSDCLKGFAPNLALLAEVRRTRAGGLHQEAAGALGPNLGVHNTETVLRMNDLCLRLGLDPVSLGFTLSFVMECREAGLLSPGDLGGMDVRFGNERSLDEVVAQVALRRGAGEWLAEGVRNISHVLGSSTAPFAMHVKGLEMAGFDPRAMTNLGLGYATAAVGPRYDICEHDVDFDETPAWPHSFDMARTLGMLSPVAADSQALRKVRDFAVLADLWSACDALNLCIFASAPTRLLSLEKMTRLIAAVTGWETSSYEFMRWGERRNHLLRIYNHREGMTAEDDRLPDRFFEEPIDSGRFVGARLDRSQFEKSMALYYATIGWDASGVPTPATRYDHHLEQTLSPV